MRIDPHAELPDSADGICTVPAAADNTVVAVSAGHIAGEGDEVLFRRAGLPGRFSFSAFNSEDEADMAIQAVKELAQSK